MRLFFVTKNPIKVDEYKTLLSSVNVEPYIYPIDEIQTDDIKKLVEDKLLKAFRLIGRPVFVEHTGLYINELNGLPGGLTQIFWDKLEADKFCELFGEDSNRKLVAKTIIGYCDSKSIHLFEGEIDGVVSEKPQGNRDFQWDCIFIPDGETLTFAELGDKKNDISMRKKAFDLFQDFLKKEER